MKIGGGVIAQMIETKKYTIKGNPAYTLWVRGKKKFGKVPDEKILAKTPYFSRAWGGKRPEMVEAVDEIEKYLWKRCGDISNYYKWDITHLFWQYLKDKYGDTLDELAGMSEGEVSKVLNDAFKWAVVQCAKVHGLATHGGDVDKILENMKGEKEAILQLRADRRPAIKKLAKAARSLVAVR